ncbi:predicted protein [Aspergillus terreus NIH2624]|uniref:Uncharacterized protein n=1 Tax=Aspergillus terreus (strain NIH 2624 / FGSC A1156) TaxID=341663 RepID=Q0CTM9_ASPTN|nr:uncharacterized protein ATEG_02955 [Aspergillus terreus NIH2624]EAU36229.1 predicted protein [Aspergillus terreus NIH2624]
MMHGADAQRPIIVESAGSLWTSEQTPTGEIAIGTWDGGLHRKLPKREGRDVQRTSQANRGLTTASGIEVRVEWRWRSERFWFERERRGEERRREEREERLPSWCRKRQGSAA